MANRREQILQSAIARIAEEGEAFSTEDVAQDAVCSQSLVFRHFGSKESLMEECFLRVCQEVTDILAYVKLPEKLTKESLDAYAMELWDYCYTYLRSNSHIARTYLFFIRRGTRFPLGYRTPGDVMKRILGDRYGAVEEVYPDFDFVAGYLMVIANLTATGSFLDWIHDFDDPKDRLDRFLRYGILGGRRCPGACTAEDRP